MRGSQRICLLTLVLTLALPCGWLSSAPAPRPRPAKGTEGPSPQPLEAAFNDIQLGMTAQEVFALMAPYEQLCTEHYQWQAWTDGKTRVSVTVWPDGDVLEGMLAGRPYRVQEKELRKKLFRTDGKQTRWVLIRSASKLK